MERIKNVYRINAKLNNGEAKEILVFSHTSENALKKAKTYILKTELKDITDNAEIKLICKDVIY